MVSMEQKKSGEDISLPSHTLFSTDVAQIGRDIWEDKWNK
jgi:hypothetical protein